MRTMCLHHTHGVTYLEGRCFSATENAFITNAQTEAVVIIH